MDLIKTKNTFVCMVLALGMLSSLGLTQAKAQENPTEQNSKDHDALRKLKGVYESAVNEGKIELLAPHLHANFTGVMVTDKAVKGMEGLKTYWAEIQKMLGDGGTYKVELVPEVSEIYGDIAISKGTTKDKVVSSAGMTFEFTTSWSAVSKKEGDEWKLLRVQGTMDPILNTFVKAELKGAFTTASSIGLLVGVVLGFVCSRLFFKKKVS